MLLCFKMESTPVRQCSPRRTHPNDAGSVLIADTVVGAFYAVLEQLQAEGGCLSWAEAPEVQEGAGSAFAWLSCCMRPCVYLPVPSNSHLHMYNHAGVTDGDLEQLARTALPPPLLPAAEHHINQMCKVRQGLAQCEPCWGALGSLWVWVHCALRMACTHMTPHLPCFEPH